VTNSAPRKSSHASAPAAWARFTKPATRGLDRSVAAKEDLRARFEREARAVASLNYPNICTLYDIGLQDGAGYMVMELLEGETLAARIEKGPIPLEQALKFATQIADALDRAHRAGVTHRDVKSTPERVAAGRRCVRTPGASPADAPTRAIRAARRWRRMGARALVDLGPDRAVCGSPRSPVSRSLLLLGARAASPASPRLSHPPVRSSTAKRELRIIRRIANSLLWMKPPWMYPPG
jgi:serine/threonine protein kinase